MYVMIHSLHFVTFCFYQYMLFSTSANFCDDSTCNFMFPLLCVQTENACIKTGGYNALIVFRIIVFCLEGDYCGLTS